MANTKEAFEKGTRCPDCLQELTPPRGGHWEYDDEPHTDPKACIRHLRSLLQRAIDRLENHNLW